MLSPHVHVNQQTSVSDAEMDQMTPSPEHSRMTGQGPDILNHYVQEGELHFTNTS